MKIIKTNVFSIETKENNIVWQWSGNRKDLLIKSNLTGEKNSEVQVKC